MHELLNKIRGHIGEAKAAPAYAPMQRLAHAEKALDAAVKLLQTLVEKVEHLEGEQRGESEHW